jgi:hypothetical protein
MLGETAWSLCLGGTCSVVEAIACVDWLVSEWVVLPAGEELPVPDSHKRLAPAANGSPRPAQSTSRRPRRRPVRSVGWRPAAGRAVFGDVLEDG